MPHLLVLILVLHTPCIRHFDLQLQFCIFTLNQIIVLWHILCGVTVRNLQSHGVCKYVNVMAVQGYIPSLGRFWMTFTAAWNRLWWSTTGSTIAGTGMTVYLVWPSHRDKCSWSWGRKRNLEEQYWFKRLLFNECYNRGVLTFQYRQELWKQKVKY